MTDKNTVIVANVTSRGCLILPLSVQQALHVDSGDVVEFVEVEAGRSELAAATGSVQLLKGMFGTRKANVSIEKMNRAIAGGGAAAI